MSMVFPWRGMSYNKPRMEPVISHHPVPVSQAVSSDGLTQKALFQLSDGNTVEAALMLFLNPGRRPRRTVCVSCQVGCPIGCPFCATGRQPIKRNLTADEMVAQVEYFENTFGASDNAIALRATRWVTNVAFMGMGEPLANFENLRQAISILGSPKGPGMGRRQIMVSTAGMAPQIVRFGKENIQAELAVSLHAADDHLRDALVPVNTRYPLQPLIESCREFIRLTGRRIYFEYALFAGINDSIADADKLVRLLGGMGCPVNLIFGNPAGLGAYQPSTLPIALDFQKRLISGGIRTMLRASRGADIEAGCGQLRSRWLSGPAPPAEL